MQNYSARNVWFDDVRVVTVEEMLVQENHYDPWGQNLPELETTGKPEQLGQYTGKERQRAGGLEWADFGARHYDAQLGRWHTQDPASQYGSPYLAMGNSPVVNVDPDGRFAFVPLLIGAAIGAFSGWQVGRAQGASGWGMVGYITGGGVMGGASGGLAAGISGAGGGAIAAGAGAGAVGGAGFAGLRTGWDGGAMAQGALVGAGAGAVGGGVAAAIGGGGGAFAGGVVGDAVGQLGTMAFDGGSDADLFGPAGPPPRQCHGAGGVRVLRPYPARLGNSWRCSGGRQVLGLTACMHFNARAL